MSGEIEDVVAESIEEIAVKELLEKEAEGKPDKGSRWELWVAFSSSLFAMLSAIAALLATLASDEAFISLSKEADYAAYAEGVDTSRAILKNKLDVLQSLGKPVSDDDRAELQRLDARTAEYEGRAKEFEERGEHDFKVHDSLAIAVTLFQMSMLLGGLSVMVRRAAVWRFGLIFSLIGSFYFAFGLAGYVA